MERMTTKRTLRIDHSLHTASRRIIDLLVTDARSMPMSGTPRLKSGGLADGVALHPSSASLDLTRLSHQEQS